MSNWPVIYCEAEIEHDKLMSTQWPVPLPVYNLNGELIAPNSGKNHLYTEPLVYQEQL